MSVKWLTVEGNELGFVPSIREMGIFDNAMSAFMRAFADPSNSRARVDLTNCLNYLETKRRNEGA